MRQATARRLTAVYLAAFFAAVAAAPHHHLNALDDLLLDGRSDSGCFVQALGRDVSGQEARLHPFQVVVDEPCLACFCGDFVAAPAPVSAFLPVLAPLCLSPNAPAAAAPERLAADASSRAPPALL